MLSLNYLPNNPCSTPLEIDNLLGAYFYDIFDNENFNIYSILLES